YKKRSTTEHTSKYHNYLEKLKYEKHSYVEIFENFKSIYSPLFFTDYDDLFGTLHTFSYSYHEARILTAIARGEQVLDINFQDWVDGENMDMDILEGIIEEIHK